MIRPLRDFIVVKPEPFQHSTALEVVTSERPSVGTIMAVGPGKIGAKGRIEPLQVKPGDKIRFGAFLFPQVTDTDGEKYLMLQEADVVGIIQ